MSSDMSNDEQVKFCEKYTNYVVDNMDLDALIEFARESLLNEYLLLDDNGFNNLIKYVKENDPEFF